tara:strand:- start:701 stop:1033 length:333 start_codon:yes stop_codon:yes gene_type:complete
MDQETSNKIETLIETGEEINLHLALSLCKGICNGEKEGEKLFKDIVLRFFYSSGYTLSRICPDTYTKNYKLGVFKYECFELSKLIYKIGIFLNTEANYTKNIINGKNNNT